MSQRCYGGVRLLGSGPSLKNIELLDSLAMPMILAMAERGIQVDLSHFAAMETQLTLDMEQITEDVRSMTGYYVNLDSGDQVADLLFKKMGLKQARTVMTSSGDRESVEDAVLTAIQHDHPVIPKMLEYKELSKLRGTYVTPIPKLARRTAFGVWRMYPNFNTTRVPSGRLSCKEPNLLAMPSRTDRGREIRKGFITDPRWTFVSVDESQIEMRIAAHRSGDENLLNIYHNKQDIYSDFATFAFRLDDKRFQDEGGKWMYPTVDKMAHRYPAKTCVLASMYRVTGKGLLEQMPVICAGCNHKATEHTCSRFVPFWTEQKCDSQILAFYGRYPGLLRMQQEDDAAVCRTAMTWDMWGRLLHVVAIRSVHEWVRSAALREAGNLPVQGGAQGTIKLTMARVHDDWEQAELQEVVHPLLQIHDELLFECRKDIAEEWGELVTERFENCVRLDVPIKASAVSADSWGLLEK